MVKPESPQTPNWRGAFWVLVLLGLAGGGVFLVNYRNKRRVEEATDAYRPVIERALAGQPRPTAGPTLGPCKVLIVNATTRQVDRLQFDLPEALRPAGPDAVGAVSVLFWDKEQVGTYENNRPAFRAIARVRVIDVRRDVALPERVIVGEPPPPTIPRNSTEGCGERPRQQVLDYLASVCQ